MFSRIEDDSQQADIRFQNRRRSPILQSAPTAVERCLQHQDAFLIEADGAFDAVCRKEVRFSALARALLDYRRAAEFPSFALQFGDVTAEIAMFGRHLLVREHDDTEQDFLPLVARKLPEHFLRN